MTLNFHIDRAQTVIATNAEKKSFAYYTARKKNVQSLSEFVFEFYFTNKMFLLTK